MHRLGGLLYSRLSAECSAYVNAVVEALGREVRSTAIVILCVQC
jgi:uncharacterized protein involved in propanediol utilization